MLQLISMVRTQISTTVYSQVLIHTAERIGAMKKLAHSLKQQHSVFLVKNPKMLKHYMLCNPDVHLLNSLSSCDL